jgi:hypothetical protein
VRQRQSVARFLCTVCGQETPSVDRWWFGLGRIQEGYFMTTEAPVHRCCADLALKVCPHLRGRADDLTRFPSGYSIMSAIVGGPSMKNDFNLNIGVGRNVVGHLKFAWPLHAIKFKAS